MASRIDRILEDAQRLSEAQKLNEAQPVELGLVPWVTARTHLEKTGLFSREDIKNIETALKKRNPSAPHLTTAPEADPNKGTVRVQVTR